MTEMILSEQSRQALLRLARQALEQAVRGEKLMAPRLQDFPAEIAQPGATFVTLTRHGQLRGCVGALEAYQPLAEDVCEHAVAAGLQDYRFPPLQLDELPEIEIEISRLTEPVRLDYTTPEELLTRLRPGIDGVTLKDGYQRATFLPQVWEKLPDPAEFLSHLCYKMGASSDLWRRKILEVHIYQVEEFHE